MNRFFFLAPLVLQTAIWIPTRALFRFFCHLKIEGVENLSNIKPGVVFAANHISELDAILVPASLPFLSRLMPMFYTSRETSFYKNSGWRQFFYGGFFFKLWGAHPLCAGKHNYELALKTHIGIVKSGRSVLIFPEGRRTLNSEERHIHGGVSFLAWASNAPIVPITISGCAKMSLADFLFRRRHIRVVFYKPIPKSELFISEPMPTVDDCKHSAESIMKTVLSPIESLYK